MHFDHPYTVMCASVRDDLAADDTMQGADAHMGLVTVDQNCNADQFLTVRLSVRLFFLTVQRAP